MDLIRREDVLRLIGTAWRNHLAAVRAEEEKAAANTAAIGAYEYAINVLVTLGVIVHDIPEAGFPPVAPAPPEYPDDYCEDEDSPTEGNEEVRRYV